MSNNIIDIIMYSGLFVSIDTLGYIIKCCRNERFASYHLRHFPTMWIWFS